MNKKEKIVKYIDFLGEYVAYFYVFAIFIESKLNLKIRYILEGLFILKIFLDYKNIKIKGKKIYYTYIIILILGVIFNFISSTNKIKAIDVFVGRNIRFYHGLMILFFINSQEKLIKMTKVILFGTFILGLGIWQKYDYIKLDIIRLREVIVLGSSYTIIYFFENLKKFKENNWNKNIYFSLISSILGLIGIAYSDSRMGFLVIVGIIVLYIIYNLIQKFSIKKMMISILIGLSGIFIFYELSPDWFKNEVKTSFETKHNFSNEARLIMWEGCWNAFKSSPIFGVGSNIEDTAVFVKEVGINTNRGLELQSAFKAGRFPEGHSMYFNFLSQVGSLTLVYLYLFFILIPKYFFKTDKNPIAVASFFGILSFFIYGITWSIWGFYGLIQTFFQVYIGILLSNLKEEQDK